MARPSRVVPEGVVWWRFKGWRLKKNDRAILRQKWGFLSWPAQILGFFGHLAVSGAI
jgi:hypothetical protein